MCNEISNKLVNFKCDNCETNSRTLQPSTSSNRILDHNNGTFKYIGTIHTEFPSKRGVPRQPTVCSEAVGKLILNSNVFSNPHHALEGLEKFSHMWLVVLKRNYKKLLNHTFFPGYYFTFIRQNQHIYLQKLHHLGLMEQGWESLEQDLHIDLPLLDYPW